MYQLLIYDLDGTLIDTQTDIVRAVNHMLRQMERTELAAKEISGYVGRGLKHLIGHSLKTADTKLIEKGSKLFRGHYAEHMMDHSRVFPSVFEFLEKFKGRNQSVITNKPDPYATNMLNTLGVGKYFDKIIASNSGQPDKPNPASIEFLLKTFKTKKNEAVLVGDSDIDIEFARRGGIPVFVITHGFCDRQTLEACKPDGIFDNFKELYQFATQNRW